MRREGFHRKTAEIDSEWLRLMATAKQLGLTVEEIRQFIVNQAGLSTLPKERTMLVR